jgi:hypothetical protein
MVARAGTLDLEFAPLVTPYEKRADAFGLPLNKYLQQVVTYAGHKVALSN